MLIKTKQGRSEKIRTKIRYKPEANQVTSILLTGNLNKCARTLSLRQLLHLANYFCCCRYK